MSDIITESMEVVPTADLQEHPQNPNEGDTQRIKKSIQDNGFYGALVVQKSTGKILAGNHRYRAAVMEGMSEVPVIWLDVDDERALKILNADNETSNAASIDSRKQKNLIESLSTMDGLGMTDDEIEDLLFGDLDFEVEEWEEEELSLTSEIVVVSDIKLQPKIRELVKERFGEEVEINEFLSVDVEKATE